MVVSVLPVDEPMVEPLPEVPDEAPEVLVSLLLEPLDDGVLEELVDGELEELPEAPIEELLLGELLEVLGEVAALGGVVDGEAPIVDDDEEDGELPAVLPLELGVLVLLPAVLGVLLLVPVPLPLVEVEPLLLPAEVPELPVPAAPEAPDDWATAYPPKARAAAAARVVRVVLVALMLNSLMELPARVGDWSEAGNAAGWTED